MLKTLVILSIALYCASAVSTHTLGDCIGANCSVTIKDCAACPVCNTAMDCAKECGYKDRECVRKCFRAVNTTKPFWEIELCTMNCMAALEEREGDPVQDCNTVTCRAEIHACAQDIKCVQAASCVGEALEDRDFKKAAVCVVDATDNDKLTALMYCDRNCLEQYVQ